MATDTHNNPILKKNGKQFIGKELLICLPNISSASVDTFFKGGTIFQCFLDKQDTRCFSYSITDPDLKL